MLCQCPKLTPLQSRLLASLSALSVLALIYWSLSNPHFAYAAELPFDGNGEPRAGEDHNWHRIPERSMLDGDELEAEGYDRRSAKRASQPMQIQGNNIANLGDTDPGTVVVWEYPNRFLTSSHAYVGSGLPEGLIDRRTVPARHHDLRKRSQTETFSPRQDSDRTIYISANTCRQPVWNASGVQTGPPPQLTLYVSTAPGNQELGPNESGQTVYPFVNGFANASVSQASGDWYMAISAPNLAPNFTGSWNYELAVSIDDYFHATNSDRQFLNLVDTDIDSALLVTNNLTQQNSSTEVYQQWANLSAPFILFAINQNLTAVSGLQNSFCGLQTFARSNNQIMASQADLEGNSTHVQMGMITRGLANKPKQQFYVTELNSSSQYTAIVAMQGNSTASGNGVVGGGGTVWSSNTPFSTKSDGNCQLLFNLSFCDEVAYAVPANPSNPNFSTFADLQSFYDNYTQTWWDPFNYTLMQIPCNTTSDARYSLAKDCNDCAAAYKEWLCAVSIPRCEDYSNPAPYLQVRNVGQPFYNNASMLDDSFLHSPYAPMLGAPTLPGSSAFQQSYLSSFATNQSRNAEIDRAIQPGPYKEVLPCEDLCYSLMQSCPASMNFACPFPGRGLEASYGRRNDASGELQCSYLGAVSYHNGAAAPPVASSTIARAWAGAIAVGLALALG